MIFARHRTRYQKQFAQRPRTDAGDTIVEVLIALSIISLLLVTSVTSINHSTASIQDAQEHAQALYLAKGQVEWLRTNNGLPTGDTCFNQTGAAAHDSATKDCDYTKDNATGCTLTAESYCYHVLITSLPTAPAPTEPYISTTYIVKVSWGTIHGADSDVTLYYKLPVKNLSYVPPVPPSPSPPGGPTPAPSVIIAQIDVGNYHVCANSLVGGGYCWGKNNFGGLGDGTNNNSGVPTQVNDTGVLAGKVIVGTSAGYNHTCVVDSTGKVYCWGYNSQGQLGNGASGTTNNPFPVAVVTAGPMNGEVIVKVNGGDSHTCALSQDGDLFCWGGNNYGQLGTGSTASSFTPAKVSNSGPGGNKHWVDISAGYAHTCALTDDGTAYCWGFNGRGQLGDGTNTDNSLPQPVSTSLKFKQISAGDQHTCAVTLAGAVYCWGGNEMGQLGNNTALDTNKPVAVDTSGVLGGKTVSKVAAGYRQTCVIGDGNVYCWGNNDYGQLGNGVVSPRVLTPVAVVNTGAMGGRFMADIATGQFNTCSVATIAAGGQVYCWGKNDNGQLGDGNAPIDSSVPVQVTFP